MIKSEEGHRKEKKHLHHLVCSITCVWTHMSALSNCSLKTTGKLSTQSECAEFTQSYQSLVIYFIFKAHDIAIDLITFLLQCQATSFSGRCGIAREKSQISIFASSAAVVQSVQYIRRLRTSSLEIVEPSWWAKDEGRWIWRRQSLSNKMECLHRQSDGRRGLLVSSEDSISHPQGHSWSEAASGESIKLKCTEFSPHS